jgi:hypothetical protein
MPSIAVKVDREEVRKNQLKLEAILNDQENAVLEEVKVTKKNKKDKQKNKKVVKQ